MIFKVRSDASERVYCGKLNLQNDPTLRLQALGRINNYKCNMILKLPEQANSILDENG